MILEVGKSYRTRGGEKAEISKELVGYTYCLRGKLGGGRQCWTKNGNFYADSGISEYDLIAEWEGDDDET